MTLRPRHALPVLALFALLVAVRGAAAANPGWDLRGSLAPDVVAVLAGAASAGDWFLPPITWRSALRMVHLVGLCLGFGTAMLLDGSVLAWRRAGRAPVSAPSLLSAGGHIVLVGFALLWASGVALVGLAVAADPAFATNPKIWAKVAIVTALTANAMVLHVRVLPAFALSAGRPIDGRWRGSERALFVTCGAISSASWVLAFVLGALPEWNYKAPFEAILVLWLIGMLMAAVAIRLLLPSAAAAAPYNGPDRRRQPAAAAGEVVPGGLRPAE